MRGPLSGVRVLALSQGGAGPFGSMLLADFGAEVIKIEPPGGAAWDRTAFGPGLKGQDHMFLALNRNKKGMELDLGTKTAKEAFYSLVKISDVVWDNFRAGVTERLGVDYDTLKGINPRIICCSITGYGSSGPYRDRSSSDIIALALSGFLSLNREPGRPPVRPGPATADLTAGLFAAFAVQAALIERERTGVGQRVEVPLLNVPVALMSYYITQYTLSGQVPQTLGSGHPRVVPFGVYPTQDGYIAVGASWPRITRVLGAEWLMDDPRFSSLEERTQHKEELNSILTELFRKHKAEDLLEVLYEEDIQAAPVNTVDKVVIDPQVVHNEMIISVPHSLGGEVKMAGNPIKMANIHQEDYFGAPTLGEHTEEILKGLLDYSDGKVQALKEEQDKHADELARHIPKTR